MRRSLHGSAQPTIPMQQRRQRVRERSECNTHSTSRRQFHRPSTAMRRRALHNVKLVLE